MPYPIFAGSQTKAFGAAVEIFSGDSDVVTTDGPVANDQVLAQYTVIALNATGQIVALNPAGADATASEAVAIGITCYAANAGTTGPQRGKRIAYYSGGSFNPAALVWPAAIDTLPERTKAFAGTNINIREVLA
ncbi:decorator protein [Pectobacterium phage MA12]|uniref:Decorator protein n=1 Tax=Pectobacterium phage MA12 TaxID=2686474 RepID=A0A6B9RJ84_9CAUD|nr:decorator protein [Pectobacterium phage MA11]YP_010000254.1 decorator protein [Pectobacterium phage MA12]QGF21040.1 decorator protein [Pectobacterium phage MA11]QHI00859.1 decorator protein [Pectobacterium phage MA12]